MNDNSHRVPPHDIDAERALLGAALINTDAADIAATVPAADFYRPAHGHIAAAIGAVRRRGEPVDLVTIPAELRRAGLLDVDGGIQSGDLVTLQSAAPSSSNAATYAHIVTGHAATRRILRAAEDLAERACSTGADPNDLLERARTTFERVDAGAGSTLAWADIAAILANGTSPTIDPDFWTRTDGKALLYAGRVHALSSEPSDGKSFLALAACAELLAMGASACYIDLEDTDAGILGRLLALGVPADQLTTQLALARPDGPLREAELADIETRLLALRPDLVVIDAMAEALAADGVDENDNIAVVDWMNRVPKRLAAAGAAVLILDHVSKSREDRGRWSRGAGSKLGAVDGAAYTLATIEPFSRDTPGKVKMTIAKDRPGSIGPIGRTVGYAHITPSAHGALVSIRIEAPTEDEEAGHPTQAMTHVSAWLAEHGPTVRADVQKGIGRRFKQQVIFSAISELQRRGHLREARLDVGPGGRGGTVLEHVRPYPDTAPPAYEEF